MKPNIGSQSVKTVNHLLRQRRIPIIVEKVVDATGDLFLPIEPRDIEDAKRKSLDACAAALCAKRYLGGEVIMSRSAAFVVNMETHVAIRYKTSAQLNRAIVVFDGGGPFKPGTYALRRPKPGHRLGDYKGAGGPHKKKRAPSTITTNLTTQTRWRTSLASIRPAAK